MSEAGAEGAAGKSPRPQGAVARAVGAVAVRLRARFGRRINARSTRPVQGLAIAGLVSVGVVAVALAMRFLDPLGYAEVGTWSPSTIRFFGIVTDFGESVFYLVPLGVALILLPLGALQPGERMRRTLTLLWLRLAFLFAAIAGTGLCVNVVKRLIGRVRPLHVDPGAIWHFEPLGWKSAAASFPSGHATTAFAVATALVLLVPLHRRLPVALVLGACAVAVCVSRVILGAHFISDVMAGALFGTLGTLWLARFLARRRLVFRALVDGTLVLRGQGAAKTQRVRLGARG